MQWGQNYANVDGFGRNVKEIKYPIPFSHKVLSITATLAGRHYASWTKNVPGLIYDYSTPNDLDSWPVIAENSNPNYFKITFDDPWNRSSEPRIFNWFAIGY